MRKLILITISILLCCFLFAQKKGDRTKRKSIPVTEIEKTINPYSFDKKNNKVSKSEWTISNGEKYIVEHIYDSVIDMNENNYKVKVWKLVRSYPNTWRKKKVGETFFPNKQTSKSEKKITNLDYVNSALKQ